MTQNKSVASSSTITKATAYTAVVSGEETSTITAPSAFVPSLEKPFYTVSSEFSNIPEARGLTWTDDFFEDDDDVVAVFDFDYDLMESFNTSVGWVWLGATVLYTPLMMACLAGGAPCFLRKNVKWSANAQHVAITRDGIRFVRDKRKTCWGLPCTDAGRRSKTVPFDKITDCDIEEPAGNTCFVIENVLSSVNIDTASSGQGNRELRIRGLKDPYSFKKLVWAMKRAKMAEYSLGIPAAMDMMRNKQQGHAVAAPTDVTSLLRDIRDELRQNNELLQRIQPSKEESPKLV